MEKKLCHNCLGDMYPDGNGWKCCACGVCMDADGRHYMPAPPPLTNADRIRGMNDKELAEFLTKHDIEQNRLRLEGNGVVLTATQLADLGNAMLCAWQDWLRKPVSATPYVSDMRQHSGLLEEGEE